MALFLMEVVCQQYKNSKNSKIAVHIAMIMDISVIQVLMVIQYSFTQVIIIGLLRLISIGKVLILVEIKVHMLSFGLSGNNVVQNLQKEMP